MRRRRLIALITVGAVLILSLSAELIVRSTLAAKVSENAAKALHATNVDTGIGATPALADVVSGRIATVSLHTTTASLCRLTNVDISVTLHDVSPFATPPAAGHTDATVLLTPETLAGVLATATVQPDPAAGVLRVRLGPGGLVDAAVRPVLDGHILSLTTESPRIAGQPVPDSLTQLFADGSGLTRHDLGGLPMGLTATGVAVTDRGLALTLAGGHTELPASTPPTTC
jgi:hypothetical protein